MGSRRQQERIRRVDQLLAGVYGEPKRGQRGRDPVGSLVGTILSQNTSRANSSMAFERLKRRFPSWEDVLAASDGEVVDSIRPGGLAEQKAPRIRRILWEIKSAHGALDLSFLAARPPEESMGYLTGFTGVGAKTAACVLLFAFGLPAFPVDTHVLRIAKRLELVPASAGAAKAQELLEEAVPDDVKHRLHVNMVAHGRELCRPRRPRCAECPIRRHCRFEDKTA